MGGTGGNISSVESGANEFVKEAYGVDIYRTNFAEQGDKCQRKRYRW